VPFPTQLNSGTLTTAGNLVFAAAAAGTFYAFDAATGEKLWETATAPGPATPITYRLDGKQYVTILAGRGEGDARGRVWTYTPQFDP
jgi:quinohemoprotein ethanol dehydrogenase